MLRESGVTLKERLVPVTTYWPGVLRELDGAVLEQAIRVVGLPGRLG